MKKEEYIKRRKAVKYWQKRGQRNVMSLFDQSDPVRGYWWAGYEQAITDFIHYYYEKLP